MRTVTLALLLVLAVGRSIATAEAPLEVLENSIGIRLVKIPAGEFDMGAAEGERDEKRIKALMKEMGKVAVVAADGEPDEKRVHRVRIGRPFFLGRTEVTNAQWKQVMGSVPSRSQADDHPVERVSWHDAVAFCDTLSALPAERSAGRVYRLPTEAEWEYACRAGTTTKFSFGDDAERLGEHGWYFENAGGETRAVGTLRPNPWGLHDMHGNVWEWCGDWYGEYGTAAETDPPGPSAGGVRVDRGGGWSSYIKACRSSSRAASDPSRRYGFLGLRLALSAPGAHPRPAGSEAGK
jgi:formylglycine-generating enzyme required for sulfatase activity